MMQPIPYRALQASLKRFHTQNDESYLYGYWAAKNGKISGYGDTSAVAGRGGGGVVAAAGSWRLAAAAWGRAAVVGGGE
ncbi:hypothetical protein [Scytonema sp. PCC 10023]|uniref:hypothetical protein n=1 Tax=Scytonema sp. PCC 10023 TaxID=1680591 RepID=UPI0039C5CB31